MNELQNDLKGFIIDAPVFFYTNDDGQIFPINEYTLRNIMVGVALGELPINLNITDQTGKRLEFSLKGGISNDPYGMNINTGLRFDLLRVVKR